MNIFVLIFYRPELVRPGQVVISQPSPNPQPTGMATSVIRISPSPSRTTTANTTPQQRVTWRVDSPGVTSPQNQIPRTSVMSNTSHQQQSIILQKALTGSNGNNNLGNGGSVNNAAMEARPVVQEQAVDHSQKVVKNQLQTNLALMVPKNERGTLYLVPQQSGFHPEKKLLVIKKEDNKFPTIMVNHRVPSTTNSTTPSVVVDKVPASQAVSIIFFSVYKTCFKSLSLIIAIFLILNLVSIG